MRFALALVLAAMSASAAPVSKEAQAPFSSLHPAATLHLGKAADWVEPTDDALWVGSREPFAVHRIDPVTNKATATVILPGTPCAGLAHGFGSLWVPLCGKPNSLARVDLKTGKLAAILPVGPAAAEGGITVGDDSIWMVTHAKGVLSRIDPATGRVRQTVKIAPGSFNPISSDGMVWVSGHDSGVVTAVDAASGKVLATVEVGKAPRFLAAGGGAIWVLLQGTGEIVRIDAATQKVTARIAAGLAGSGGDIKFGGGKVWATLMGTPLTRIDAKTGRIEKQWTGPGGDSLAYAFDSVWITDFKKGTVARYPADGLGTAPVGRSFVICDKLGAAHLPEEADVFVEPNGQIFLNGSKITVDALKEYATGWAKLSPPVVVSGRANTSYSKIVSTISLLRAAGIKQIACETPQP